MKKLILGLLITSSVYFISCNGNEEPSPDPGPAIAADAIAGLETFLALAEACPPCLSNPLWAAGIGGATAVIAGDASGLFGRSNGITHSNGKDNNITLDANFLLSNNPFEKIGISHNLALNYLNKAADIYQKDSLLSNYNLNAWNEILQMASPELTSEQREEVYTTAKSSSVIGKVKGKGAFFTNSDPENIRNTLRTSTLSLDTQDHILEWSATVLELAKQRNSTADAAGYINSEISKILIRSENLSLDENAEIVFLTTLKHSYSYWIN